MGRFCFLGGLLCITAPAVQAQELLRYNEGEGSTHVYARSQEDHVTQTVNGQPQNIDIRSYWRFRTTVRERRDDVLQYEIVHDSLSIQSTPPGTVPDLSDVYDKPVVILLGERGEVRGIELPEPLPTGAARLDLITTYKTFFPLLPREPAAPGMTWQDTLQVDTSQRGMQIHVMRINTYTVGGTLEYQGRSATRIDYTSTVDLNGSGVQEGSQIDLSGSGTVRGAYYFSASEGLYLGEEESSDLLMNAYVVAGDQNLLIPIIQKRVEKVEFME